MIETIVHNVLVEMQLGDYTIPEAVAEVARRIFAGTLEKTKQEEYDG